MRNVSPGNGGAASRIRQRGLTLIGFLLAAVVVGAVLLLALRTIPSVVEYRAIVGAVNKITSDRIESPREVQRAFDRFAAVDDITSIAGKDLLVQREPDGTMSVSFAYEKRISLYGPVSLVIEYEGGKRAP